MFGTEINIEPILKIDKNQLSKNLEDISAQLPDTVTESSYYIEGSNLIITAGKDGNVVDVEASIEAIKTAISDFSANNGPVELVVKTQSPKDINIDSIYNEVKKEPKDAYYTREPFTIYPSENGIDFKISIDEAKAMVAAKNSSEYTIPLNIIRPVSYTHLRAHET